VNKVKTYANDLQICIDIICDIWLYFFKCSIDVFEISFYVHNGRRWLGIFGYLKNGT
jgi:hypothetical protein